METRLLLVAASLGALAAGRLGAQPSAAVPARSTPESFGTTVESFYRIPASRFTPLETETTYSDEWSASETGFHRFITSPSGGSLVASPHLPSGAILTSWRLDSCDTNPTLRIYANLSDCEWTGSCDLVTQLDSNQNIVPNACSSVSHDLPPSLGLIVNNYGRQLSIRITTQAGDATTSFSGVVLGYKLQVAPAPATPTFNDIPISDFGFQFIEALAASGITGGCGGGRFCPDEPVKRRQMAIFLAKALGLYLPQY